MDAKKQKWLSGELSKIEDREHERRTDRVVMKVSLVSKDRLKMLEDYIDLILSVEERNWEKKVNEAI